MTLQDQAEMHLPLVRSLARRFPFADQEELYQQGVIGLMKALHRFDPARGTAFSTFAVPLILGEMRQAIRNQSPLHISRQELTLRAHIRQAEDMLAKRLYRAPTVGELAQHLRMDASELLLAMEEITVSSMDALEHAPVVPDPEDWQQRVELRDILARLPVKDQQLIFMRHRTGLTQTQAGQRLGMSQMQVSRREKIIRTLLRRALAD